MLRTAGTFIVLVLMFVRCATPSTNNNQELARISNIQLNANYSLYGDLTVV